MEIRNENGDLIDIDNIEKEEQDLAREYILENDVVLELGARYGSVSCIINSKLSNKNNQVSVEPDKRVWNALEENRNRNNCYFNIVNGFISSKKLGLMTCDDCLGYGTSCYENNETNIPSYTLDEIKQQYNLNFNVLVADCEGFLEEFLDENPNIYNDLRLIIFEADRPERCNYDKIRNNLCENNFVTLVNGFQNVWIKKSS